MLRMRAENIGQPRKLAVLVAVVCLVAVCRPACGQQDEDGHIEVRWGIADTAAMVGRLFRMHIPGDAFSGDVKSFTIKTIDGLPLPSWLQFYPVDNIIEGFPTPKDVGQTYLELTAHGKNPKDQASVTFTVVVRDVASHTSGAPLRFKKTRGPEFVRCRQTEPETVATLVLDVDMEALPVSERVSLLKRFLEHMGLHEEMVKILPVGGQPIHDGSALVSGVGDTPNASPQSAGTFVSWPVGCGQVKEGHFPALTRLDEDSGSGRMARSIRYPVIGWHVTNSHLQAPKRKRRAAGLQTATPVVTPVMPTKTMSEEDATEKMTHTVVDRSSPVFIQPTPTSSLMEKTDEPKMSDEVKTPMMSSAKPMTSEATPALPPMEKSKDMIKPTKSMTTKATKAVTPPVMDPCVKGQAPRLREEIPEMTYKVGDVINFVIPEGTFEDCERGGTRGLDLVLLKDKTKRINETFFFQLNKKEQRFIGLPGSEDVGQYQMNLVASKDTEVANTEFLLKIESLPMKESKSINHKLSMGVDYDYDKFMKDVGARVQLSNNIASVFGDPDASNLLVTEIRRGSVLYSWTNKSVASGGCPTGDISGMVNKMVNPDGTLTKEAIEKLKPFKLISAESAPAGQCEGDASFPAVKSKPIKSPEKDEDKVAKGSTGDSGGDNKLLTTVVPAVVIVVGLLVMLLVACLLYRRKRKGKMNVEEKNTFINKHPPVIFPDELDDKPSSDPNKPLLLDNGEGSNSSASCPPPEYHRGTSESPERPPNNGGPTKNGSHEDNDEIVELPERPYEPPPPVTSSGGSGKTPRPAQQPLSQHPEILP
ncbi:dystroglycan [Plakobranchus ocellatus]|uniref:Dystroglycan 1 n=1 Tax=Plakobranchus ocellatus TaxID=259542 RepID=A0AAV4A6V2_9GAST|nr:dystroglycan [Plakobranchus ocellatus]